MAEERLLLKEFFGPLQKWLGLIGKLFKLEYLAPPPLGKVEIGGSDLWLWVERGYMT